MARRKSKQSARHHASRRGDKPLNRGAARHAAIGAFALAVVGGAWLLWDRDTPAETTSLVLAPSMPPLAEAQTAAAWQAPPTRAEPPQSAPAVAPMLNPQPAGNAADRPATRRQATLDRASPLQPGAAGVATARDELRQAKPTDERGAERGQAPRDDRIDRLVARARDATVRRDYAAADRALAEAERLERTDRLIEQARAELETARGERPPRR